MKMCGIDYKIMNYLKKGALFLVLLLSAFFIQEKSYAANANVARMTIVANDNGIDDFGHVFIVITNISSKTLQVGPYSLKKNQQVSLGLRDSFYAHFSETGGAYYNVEMYQPYVYKSFAYRSISITNDEINTIYNSFRSNSSYNVALNNCATAAVRAWNKIVSKQLKISEDLIAEPWKIKDRIKSMNGGKSGTSLVGTVVNKKLQANQVYYLNNKGNVFPYRVIKPTNVSLKAINCNQVKVTWNRPKDTNISGQDMVTGYKIYYAYTNDATVITLNNAKTTEYTVKKLAAGRAYKFKVFAVFLKNGFNVLSDASNKKTATTNLCKTTLNHTSIKMKVDEAKTVQLKATSTGKHSGTLAKVTWSSSNKKIATVNSRGLVTGKSNGTTKIIATIHGKSAACKVTVVKPAIELTPSSVTLNVGSSSTLKATVIGSSKKVLFMSSNTAVATVSSSGVIKAKKDGTAVITATAGKLKAQCKVTVSSKPELLAYMGKNIDVVTSAFPKTWYDSLLDKEWYNSYLSIQGSVIGQNYLRFYTDQTNNIVFKIRLSVFNTGGYPTSSYQLNGLYTCMEESDIEESLKYNGWRKCTSGELNSYGIVKSTIYPVEGYYIKGDNICAYRCYAPWVDVVTEIAYGKASLIGKNSTYRRDGEVFF